MEARTNNENTPPKEAKWTVVIKIKIATNAANEVRIISRAGAKKDWCLAKNVANELKGFITFG